MRGGARIDGSGWCGVVMGGDFFGGGGWGWSAKRRAWSGAPGARRRAARRRVALRRAASCAATASGVATARTTVQERKGGSTPTGGTCCLGRRLSGAGRSDGRLHTEWLQMAKWRLSGERLRAVLLQLAGHAASRLGPILGGGGGGGVAANHSGRPSGRSCPEDGHRLSEAATSYTGRRQGATGQAAGS